MKKTICFLLICIIGILFSCKEDEGVLNPHSHEKSHQEYKRSIVSFQDMKAKLENSSGLSVVLFNNVSSRGGDDYIQKIDSSYILQLTNDTLTTFTMKVITKDEEDYAYSNLIIRTFNGKTEEFIAHYSPTTEWQEAHDNGEDLEYEGAFDLFDTNGNPILIGSEEGSEARGGGCWGIETTWEACYGATCPCTDGNGTITYNVVFLCETGGGGGHGGGTVDNPDLPTDPWNGGGSGGGSHTHASIFESEFLGQLITLQKNWLSSPSNVTILNQMLTYLELYGGVDLVNGWYNNAEAVWFAGWAIGYLMDNPSYDFNDLMWIQNLGFSGAEKSHIMMKPNLVSLSNEVMKQTDLSIIERNALVGVNVAFEAAYANNTLSNFHQNPWYQMLWNTINGFLTDSAYNNAAKVFRFMNRYCWMLKNMSDPVKVEALNVAIIDPSGVV